MASEMKTASRIVCTASLGSEDFRRYHQDFKLHLRRKRKLENAEHSSFVK